MNKIVLLLWFAVSCITLNAQPQVVGKARKVIQTDGQVYMNAVWSPDGDCFAFTSGKYNGILVSDSSGQNVRKITSDKSAGFGFKWSADSETILARPVVVEDNKRYHQVKIYDVSSGAETVIQEKTRALKGLPVWTGGDQKVAMQVSGRVKVTETGKSGLKRASRDKKLVDFGGTLVAGTAKNTGDKVSFPRFDGRHVFNSRVSPRGDKVVFEVNGLGLHVANIDGTGLKQIGYGEHASWMPGSRYVIVNQVEDDGYTITSGKLFSVDTETGAYYPLFAESEIVALKPSVSPGGRKVLFNNPVDGAIYVLEIK